MPSFSPARGRNATATIGRMNEPVHAAGDGLDTDGLITGATLVTLDGDAGYGVVEDGTLAWRDGVIRFAGPRAELPAELAGDAIDVGGACITPGLVDCPTHAVFAGHRAGGFDRKSVGAGKSVSVSVDPGGRRIIKTKKEHKLQSSTNHNTHTRQ